MIAIGIAGPSRVATIAIDIRQRERVWPEHDGIAGGGRFADGERVAAAAEAGFGSPSHGFTHFPVPNGVGGIAVGPAGDVWFTGNDRIGRLRAGVVTEFATPTAISSPQFITAGPDGNTWFPQYNLSPIGRITNDLIASVTSAPQGCSP